MIELWILHAMWRAGDMHPDTFHHLANWSSVVSLRLRDVTFPTVATLGHLVRAFHNLNELSCMELAFSTTRRGPLRFMSPTTKIKQLRLIVRESPSMDIANVLVATKINETVDNLILNLHQPLGVEEVRDPSGHQYLLDASPSLRSLELWMSMRNIPLSESMTNVRHTGRSLRIVQNQQIESIAIGILLDDEDAGCDWISRLMSTATVRDLRKFSIHLFMSGTSPHRERLFERALNSLSFECCREIEDTLSLPIFSNLSQVELLLRTRREATQMDWSEAIRARFSKFFERGILSAKMQ